MSERKPYRRLPDLSRSADDAARDVDHELEFHLEMRIREFEEAGLTPDEARREAARRFGDVEAARRRLRGDASRAVRRTGLLQLVADAARDVVYAARALRSSRGYAAVAVGTLALGIGATTAIFSVVNAVLLRPLPYAEPERLVQMYEAMPPEVQRNVVSRGTYLDWRDGTHSFTEVAAYMLDFGYGITGDGEPLQATGAQASPGLFRVLGVDAMIGRTFTDAEGERGGNGVVLLSHAFWQNRFGGERSVLGQTITIDGSPVEVIGVMPPDFDFPSRRTDIWLPAVFSESDRTSRQSHMLHVVGRLAPGATLESAREELRSISERQRQIYPDAYDGWATNVFPLRADIVRSVRSALWVLLGAVGLVLLIASVNVANLLLARSLTREQEVSVRAALGAGRFRLVRQFLAEGAVLAFIGGAVGVVLAALAVGVLVTLDPGDIPLLIETRLDGRVLAFAATVTFATVFVFALTPALRLSRADLHAGLRIGRGPSDGFARHRGLRSGLLVTELAVSVVLVVGAGLLLRSFAALQDVDAGFDMDNVLVVSLNLPTPAYSAPERQIAFYDELTDRLAALPGVLAAGGTTEPPIVGFAMTRSIEVEGYTFADDERSDLPYHAVTPGYFDMLRIPVIAGRGFTANDRAGSSPVIVVNESMVHRFWPSGDAVGRRVRLAEAGPWYEIVGVVGDTRHDGLDTDPHPLIYAPFAQKDWNWLTWMTVMARTRSDPLALAHAVQREVWAIDPNLPIQTITTLDGIYAESIGRRRFNTTLLGAFAVLALILGAVGVYGVVAYTVAQRSREIGIRMALGARAGSVVAGIVGDGLRLAIAGAVIGLIAALATSSLLSGLLFGIATTDAITFIGAPLLITIVALIATWLPARRAAAVEPLRVLREG